MLFPKLIPVQIHADISINNSDIPLCLLCRRSKLTQQQIKLCSIEWKSCQIKHKIRKKQNAIVVIQMASIILKLILKRIVTSSNSKCMSQKRLVHMKNVISLIYYATTIKFYATILRNQMNIRFKGDPFFNQTTHASGSACGLHDIVTVSPSVTFILWGRSSIDWNTGLAVTMSNTTMHYSLD